MFTHQPVSPAVVFSSVLLASLVTLPVAATAAEVPSPVLSLLPKGAEFGHGDWVTLPTEFGTTFSADIHAGSFPGQNPSCDLAGTTHIAISLRGDTAFEDPPMLDMVVADFEQNVARATAPLDVIASTYATSVPNVVSVGSVKQVERPNGQIFYIQYQEDCRPHPNGYKTKLRGLARRGATQLDFTLLLALDETATQAMADEILANFEKLDIPALTK